MNLVEKLRLAAHMVGYTRSLPNEALAQLLREAADKIEALDREVAVLQGL